MTIKIKLSSGKEIELTPEELVELLGMKQCAAPVFVPYIQPSYPVPNWHWPEVWCQTTTGGGAE